MRFSSSGIPAPRRMGWRWVRSAVELALAAAAVWTLYQGYAHNRWHSADAGWFEQHQRDTQAHVLGQIVKVREGGFAASGGFNGVSVDQVPPGDRPPRPWPTERDLGNQYQMFQRGETRPEYDPYWSQPGAQGWFFAWVDSHLPRGKENRLEFLQSLTAWGTACVVTALLFLIAWAWGPLAAILAFGMAMNAPWLAVIARNLWWVPGAFYFPLVVTGALMLQKTRRAGTLFLAAQLAMVVKCLLTGFEYITATLVMSQLPVIYAVLARSQRWKTGLLQLLGSSLGALLGTALILVLLALQIGRFTGDITDGWEHVRYSYFNRTNSERILKEVPDLLEPYWTGVALDPEAQLEGNGTRLDPSQIRESAWTFRDILHIQLWTSLTALLLALGSRRHRRTLVAATITVWAALLAPLSWFLLFAQHSATHTHMNQFCWHLPWTPLVAALVGMTAQTALAIGVRRVAGAVQRLRNDGPESDAPDSASCAGA